MTCLPRARLVRCTAVVTTPSFGPLIHPQTQSTMRSWVPDAVAAAVYVVFAAALLHQGLWNDLQSVVATSMPMLDVRLIYRHCVLHCCIPFFPSQVTAFAALFTQPRVVLLAWLHLLTLDLFQAKYGPVV